MREVIAVCRSRKIARERVASVLDRYFWRIGDRTWRGKASNACLDRVARELRKHATRATAVSIQEVRSSVESRMPLIRVGSRSMFSEDGLAPVSAHPSAYLRALGPSVERNGMAVVRIAALFHDLGKATRLFQGKMRAFLNGASPQADIVRHELVSTAVWDRLFGRLDDHELKAALAKVSPGEIDAACRSATDWLLQDGAPAERRLAFDFLSDERRLVFAIGILILVHHRLPEGDSDHLGIRGGQHGTSSDGCRDVRRSLEISDGVPFWHEPWWLRRLSKEAATIVPGQAVEGLDIALRGALVLADHLGSSESKVSTEKMDFIANTRDGAPADSLTLHVRKVYQNCRPSFDLLHRLRDRLPALAEEQMPVDLCRPEIDHPRFSWQMEAARAARALAGSGEGGFFACLLSGTGTGKTRGAPTILAGAAFGDIRPERRYFRMTLGLGLRVLASQSAREYVHDLGLSPEHVQVLVGTPPIDFKDAGDKGLEAEDGSESLSAIPEWLRIERSDGPLPGPGSPREPEWLRGLSVDTDRSLPAIVDRLVDVSGRKGRMLKALAETPVIVGTVDHLMEVAAPTRSRFLPAAIRTLTSDLILDEIDQYGPEDIAALARLVFQAAAGGRRVIIMSATLTRDVGEALHAAYCSGWRSFAVASGISSHVHLLMAGDAPDSIATNIDGQDFGAIHDVCRARILSALTCAPVLRRGEILAPCESWSNLVAQVSDGCRRMHDLNAASIDGFRVSVGLVRMTRISHTSALFQQLPAGIQGGRLRVKVCLHSAFPRLHRAWVEMRLKRALTRKTDDPQAGLRDLCRAEGLFVAASRLGVTEIEIVCVTSPVIETGNDLDFDYAILDPISMRSIVQAAGRVRRHRPGNWSATNVLILGRSPIALQGGKLAMPGVETPAPVETGVSRGNLDGFPGRAFPDLAGDVSFDCIDAAPIISDDLACPLRDEEARLRRAMLVRCGDAPPLGRYLDRVVARMNARFTRTRMFRRSTTRSLRYALSGDGIDTASWVVDLSSGRGAPIWRPASDFGLQVVPAPEDGALAYLFTDILKNAWHDYARDGQPLNYDELKRLVSVDVSDYSNEFSKISPMTFSEQTGFTRNTPEDLFSPFGSRI